MSGIAHFLYNWLTDGGVRLSALCAGRPLSPGKLLVLISVSYVIILIVINLPVQIFPDMFILILPLEEFGAFMKSIVSSSRS
jgi:hypothetical protein